MWIDYTKQTFADDTQIYGSCSPVATAVQLQQQVSVCIDEVAVWMRCNRLQLNTAKTEVLWCTSSRHQHQIPLDPVRIGTDSVRCVSSVQDIGIYIDSNISMRPHISKTVSSCFATLRQLRSIRRSVTRPVLVSLIASLVLTHLDYGNAALAGVPSNQLNTAARLVYSTRKYEHTTPLLRDLH